MGIALTILCICSVAELALLILISLSYNTQSNVSSKNRSLIKGNSAEPASVAEELGSMSKEELERKRKEYEDEMKAFQALMNYNADVAYGIETQEFKE